MMSTKTSGVDSIDLMPLFKKGNQVIHLLVKQKNSDNFAICHNEWKLIIAGNQMDSQKMSCIN
jgi:hypothetical protein